MPSCTGHRLPPVRLNPDMPAELEEIINKALEKDRNLRYQHAADMRADLQRLKRDTDSGRTAQHSCRKKFGPHFSCFPSTALSQVSTSQTTPPSAAPSTQARKSMARDWKFLVPTAALLIAVAPGIL